MALETEVWDLCRPEGVRAARAFKERNLQDLGPSSLALALHEAVNSSSQARRTPLHAAAEAGNASMVQVPSVSPSCMPQMLLPNRKEHEPQISPLGCLDDNMCIHEQDHADLRGLHPGMCRQADPA